MRAPRSRVALLLAAFAVSGVISAVAMETFARHRESRRRVPGFMPLLYYPHRRRHHGLVRDSDYFDLVHIDRHGFRGGPVSLVKPEGAWRIIAVGGSTTFDTQTSGDAHAWPAQLEASLRASGAAGVEVINAGAPGYSVLDDLIRLQTDVHRFHPDVLLLYEGHNDLFHALARDEEAADPRTPDEIDPITPWSYWLQRHSLFYSKIAARLQSMRATSPAKPVTDPAEWKARIEAGVERFDNDLSSLVLLARRFAPLVVLPELVQVSGVGVRAETDAEVAALWQRTIGAPTEVVLEAYARYNETIASVARRYGVALVSTGSFGLSGAAWYAERDPIHFNDQGARRMGERMGAALLASGAAPHAAPALTSSPAP